MFAVKIRHFLNNNILLNTQSEKFEGYVNRYYQLEGVNTDLSHINQPQEFVKQQLSTINHLKNFIKDIKRNYKLAQGDFRHFKAYFFQFNNFQQSQKITNTNLQYTLFNILIGQSTPKVYTFNFWDRILAQIIHAWAVCHGFQMKKEPLFQLIDSLNGDQSDVNQN